MLRKLRYSLTMTLSLTSETQERPSGLFSSSSWSWVQVSWDIHHISHSWVFVCFLSSFFYFFFYLSLGLVRQQDITRQKFERSCMCDNKRKNSRKTVRLSNDPRNLFWQRPYLKRKLTRSLFKAQANKALKGSCVCNTKAQWAFISILHERPDTWHFWHVLWWRHGHLVQKS